MRIPPRVKYGAIICLLLGASFVTFWFARYNSSDVGAVNLGSISLVSSKSTYGVGEMVAVDVKLDTAGQSVNSVGLYLSYPSSMLQYDTASVDTPQADFILAQNPKVSTNGANEVVALVGGYPAAGGKSGANLQVVHLEFRVKAVGSPVMTLVPSQSVADSYTQAIDYTAGTNVIGTFNNLSLTLTEAPPVDGAINLSLSLAGRRVNGASIDQTDSLSIELRDAQSAPLTTPVTCTSTTNSSGRATLRPSDNSCGALVQYVSSHAGTNYKLRVRPVGYLAQTIDVSSVSLDSVLLSFASPFIAGSFTGDGSAIALGDFASLAAYFNNKTTNPGLEGAFGSRARGSLLNEFAVLAANYNKK